MKKGLLGLSVSLLMCSSLAYATPIVANTEQAHIASSEIQSTFMNKDDSDILFGSDTVENVILLSQNEMIETQGAGSWTKFRNKVVKHLKKPETIFSIVYTAITIAVPPAASVTIPGVYSGAIWIF